MCPFSRGVAIYFVLALLVVHESAASHKKRIHRSPRKDCDPNDFWCSQSRDDNNSEASSRKEALATTPRTTPKCNGLFVQWRSKGDGRGVFGYRVQYRTEGSDWKPYGQIVPYVSDNYAYSQTLASLQANTNYYIQIQVLDRNSYVLYVTSEILTKSGQECSHPEPARSENLQIRAPSYSHSQSQSQYSQQVQSLEAPSYVQVVNTNVNSAYVMWKSTYSEDVYVDKYKCRYAPTGTQHYEEKQFPAKSVCDSKIAQQARLPTPPGTQMHCGRIDNLQNEQSYDFQVAAHVQNQGWTPYSPPQRTVVQEQSSYRTAVAAAAVQEESIDLISLTKTASTDMSLDIAWDIRAEDKARVTAFRIIITPVNNPEHPQTINVDRSTYQYHLSNLRSSTAYNITVSAANSRMICGGRTIVAVTDAQVRPTPPPTLPPIPPPTQPAIQNVVPGAVRNFRLTGLSSSEIRVSWACPPDGKSVTGYDVSYRLKYRLACPDEVPRDVSTEFVTIYNHKNRDYTITGLIPYAVYEVKVRARTLTDLGPEVSGEAATEMQPPSAPPFNLRVASSADTSLALQWEAIECSQRNGIVNYYEYEIVGQDDWAKWERRVANTTSLRVKIDGLTPYTKYIVRVRAYNSAGGGPFTENLDVMTAIAKSPLPPQDLVVVQEGIDYFMISWMPPYPPYGPLESHKIRYKLVGSNRWEEIVVEEGDSTLRCPTESPRYCYNVTGLQSGSQYEVKVATRIRGGDFGPCSKPVIANTLQAIPDAPRSINLIEKTDHSLHIRWTPPLKHVTQYRVSIVAADGHDRKRTFIVDHPTTTYLFEELEAETRYNISISAGTEHGFSEEIWAVYTTDVFNIPIIINTPKLTAYGSHALDVEWEVIVDARHRFDGYIIEIRTLDSSTWTEVGGITPHFSHKSVYSKRIDQLEANTVYVVRIKVYDKKLRVGAQSPEIQGRTGCGPPTLPPQNIRLTCPSTTEVRVSWEPPHQSSWKCSNVKYRLDYVEGEGTWKTIEKEGHTAQHIFESKEDTQWIVRMKTINEAGSSSWSQEETITTLVTIKSTTTTTTTLPTPTPYHPIIYTTTTTEGTPPKIWPPNDHLKERVVYKESGWPWWWLLLLLLPLLCCIPLCCWIPWLLGGGTRRTKESVIREEKSLLLKEERLLRQQIDERLALDRAKGEFEQAYIKGFQEARSIDVAAAKVEMHEKTDRFHEGYVKGLRDAGMTEMSMSMHNLATKTQKGYSAGFMQGYRDGSSGAFGDKVTATMMERLDEQYFGQEEFKQGYVAGFRESASTRTQERRAFEETRSIHQSLTELCERLAMIEKKEGGDNIHSTKIYHVCEF
ncbi:hypothetical protein WR25_19788 isoform L [Diploscapter pachys]|uniref:Fibronectin type-III domain-containing protein n=1 Tax=Diploscapter pachys TaxID=2018661 RepID=A0A2A2JDN8_9BILA|nr:hypothetical protein WR25_19788 isoform B [Diploscapter pachys]PAV59862.1 hypothetical protein WR25_19788 isoform D [Diploscapter pachys]PAV59865.1 hypothetical protein WR25_19788 isoform G [Diploscapter pachys]PAV59870.1 hypothetical protein WR25_19788 isoform L [Diploscapter pachys]